MRERGKKISNCKSKKTWKFLTRLMITYLGIDFLRGVSNVPLTSFPTLMSWGTTRADEQKMPHRVFYGSFYFKSLASWIFQAHDA